MNHDQLCELPGLPGKPGQCKCTDRLLERDPIPEYLVPIYPAYVNPNARPVHTSTTWQASAYDSWAARQVTPEEMEPCANS
jgi:hypothetical protein